jgi:hypothetical protein
MQLVLDLVDPDYRSIRRPFKFTFNRKMLELITFLSLHSSTASSLHPAASMGEGVVTKMQP